MMKAVVASEGVRIEAKATVGVVKLGSVGIARGNRGAVRMVEGQEFGEQAGGNAPRRIATTRCSGSRGVLGEKSQIRRL